MAAIAASVLTESEEFVDSDASESDDEDGLMLPNNTPLEPPDTDLPISGIVQTLMGLKETISREIDLHGMPLCYHQGHFWIHPTEPFFAMHNALLTPDGLTPNALYPLLNVVLKICWM